MWISTQNGGAVNLKDASAITKKALAFNHHVVYAVIYADKEYLYVIESFENRDEAVQYIEGLITCLKSFKNQRK